MDDLQKLTHRQTNVSIEPGSNSYALVPDYLSFRNTWFGQPQPVAYKLIWRAYLEEPIIRACVDITVDAIIGDGYTIEGKSEANVRFMRDLFKRIGFQTFLHDMITSLIIYGDSYAELVRDGGGLVEYFRPVDAATIRIDYDEHGSAIKYIQRVLHRRVDFYPDEMLHLSLNTIGGRAYGNSWLQSTIFTLQSKIAAQNFNTEYFRRPGLPRSLYITKNLSSEQVSRLAVGLRQATPQTDLLLNAQAGEITHQLISPNNQDMQFIELMEFLRTEIIAASGVPPIFLGITEGSNRANAQTQLEAWDRRKRKYRIMIQDIIDLNLLNVANFGFDDVVLKFNDNNSREQLKNAQMAQLLSGIPYATPNQVLQTAGLPIMDDEMYRFDSFTGEIRHKTPGIGDTPIYITQQKLQMESQKADNRNQGDANPSKNPEKKDNANRLNAEQANETRSKTIDAEFTKSDPFKTYPYGAVEPEKELLDPVMRQDFKARLRAIAEVHLRAMRGENFEYDDTQRGKAPFGHVLPAASKPEPLPGIVGATPAKKPVVRTPQ